MSTIRMTGDSSVIFVVIVLVLPPYSASSTCPPSSQQVGEDISGVENVHWLNSIVSQAWPNLKTITLLLTRENIEPLAQQAFQANALLQGFSFESIDPGSESIKVDGVRVHEARQDVKGRIVMDVDISYNGDANCQVSFIGISGGVNRIVIKGRIRVEMYLMDWLPLLGGTVIYFTENPHFDFNLHGWANIGDIPGLRKTLREPINSLILTNMVYPNKINIRSEPGIGNSMLSKSTILMPRPTGVLTVKIVRAKNLLKKELFNFSPYCILTLGSISKRSTQKSGTTPSWEEVFEFPLDIPEGFKVNLEILEHDTFTKDDSLGKTSIDVGKVVRNGTIREWEDLVGVGQGNLLVESSWTKTSSSPSLPDGSVADRVVVSVYVGAVNVYASRRSRVEKLRAVVTMDGAVGRSKEVQVNKLSIAEVDEGFTLIGNAGAVVVIEVIEVGTEARISKIDVEADTITSEVVTVEDPSVELDLSLRYIVPSNV